MTPSLIRIAVGCLLPAFPLLAASPNLPVPETKIAQVESQFADPPSVARPGFYWHWPGGATQPAQIEHELRAMKDAGFYHAHIVTIDRTHWQGEEAGFGTPAWDERVKVAIEKAAALGMTIDVSPCTAWPWTYNGPEPIKVAALEIGSAEMPLTGPTSYRGAVPRVAAAKTARPRSSAGGQPLSKLTNPAEKPLQPQGPVFYQATLSRVVGGQPVAEPARVVTSQVDAQGNISVDVPAGDWMLTGFWVWPSAAITGGEYSPGGGGYVSSIWDKDAVARDLSYYIDPILSIVDPKAIGTAFRAVYMDNPERYVQNWSWNFLRDFQTLRGYDLTPWLPVVVNSLPKTKASSRGVKGKPKGVMVAAPTTGADDIRRRILADVDTAKRQMCSLYGYGGITDWAHAKGLLSRAEGHDSAIGDYEDNYGVLDIPEFEVIYDENHQRNAFAALSGGHIYGRRLVATESFTYLTGKDGWDARLDVLRKAAANIMGWGSNQFTIHSFTYTDADQVYPGWYFRASSYINERTPFFPYMRQLADYLARNCLVMQAGDPVVDVCWLAPGNDNNALEAMRQERQKVLGGNLKADGATELGFLQNQPKMVNGRLSLGLCQYKLIVVSGQLELEGLQKLKELIAQGLNVYFTDGSMPTASRYFRDYGKRDAQIAALGHELLGGSNPTTLGQGRIWSGGKLEDVLKTLDIQPQIAGPAEWPVTDKSWQHRQGDDFDAFYLNNTADADIAPDKSWWFRAKGTVELWDANTARLRSLPATDDGAGVRVSFPIPARGTALIVIRRDRAPAKPPFTPGNWQDVQTLAGNWEVTFHRNELVEPVAHLSMTDLTDWGKLEPVQKFAGTGEYHLTFNFAGPLKAGAEYRLSLGEVDDAAEVSLNGTRAGIVIEKPYQVDVTGQLKPGPNELVVKVANRYANYAGPKFPSGLLGPVVLQVSGP